MRPCSFLFISMTVTIISSFKSTLKTVINRQFSNLNDKSDESRLDFDSKDVHQLEIKSNELRDFREYGNTALQLFKNRDIKGAINSFQQAAMSNSSQPLAQLGICYYCEERFDDAVKQLDKDIKLIEKSKQFKASDLRLWLSAAYNRLGKKDDAYYALDLNNINVPGVYEQRLLMNYTLNFFGESLLLDDMLDYIGQADEKDFEGRRFYGNFYLGLYYDSIKNMELSEAFLQYPRESKKYRSNDMWYHLPRVLYDKRFVFEK